MSESCSKHPHEKGVDLCRRCGGSWCGSCLVYVFGPKKAPYCMSCAMVAGGVRSSSTFPALPRKERKARMRAQQAEAKAALDAAREAELLPDVEPVLGDGPVETDWASPWWEDRQPTMAD